MIKGIRRGGDRRYKLFLGGYVNEPNAQNINCECIARYIDKDLFEVHICYDSTMPINRALYNDVGIQLHKVIRHRYLDVCTKYLAMKLSDCDIYYLPKRERADVLYARRHRNKALVGSVEGNALSPANRNKFYRDYYLSLMTSSFAISNSVAKNAEKAWEKELMVIPFGTELQDEIYPHKRLLNVCWVGSLAEHKHPLDLLDVAVAFPELTFTIIGKGKLEAAVLEKAKELRLENVKLLGQLSNKEVYGVIKKCDLLLMTSEHEGLPKVIQEAAACGLPSIYINKYYSVDFIVNGVNGFGVSTIAEMINIVKELIVHPEVYQQMSNNAINVIQSYGWPRIIKQYEAYFLSLSAGESV